MLVGRYQDGGEGAGAGGREGGKRMQGRNTFYTVLNSTLFPDLPTVALLPLIGNKENSHHQCVDQSL